MEIWFFDLFCFVCDGQEDCFDGSDDFFLNQELVSTRHAVYISCLLIFILSLKKKVFDFRNVGFLSINRF